VKVELCDGRLSQEALSSAQARGLFGDRHFARRRSSCLREAAPGLISDLRPEGPLQNDEVEAIVRLKWRLQNLDILRIAESARKRYAAIWSQTVPSTQPPCPVPELGTDPNWVPPDPAVVEAAKEAAVAQAQEELGHSYVFVRMGKAITFEQMLKDLEVENLIHAMIGKLLKQLLHVRGLKSFRSADLSPPLPRIPGPQKAA
jgi:hypothetical protein